jgi:prepilin-type N-terminal cleavage/methylation domain-containing protein
MLFLQRRRRRLHIRQIARQHHFSHTPAFTLIEFLVVIAVIGLLSSIVFASLNSARAKAREAQRIAVVQELQKAVELFYADHNRYPGFPGAFYTTAGEDWFIRNPINGDPNVALSQLRSELAPYLPTLPSIPKSQKTVVYYGKDNTCHLAGGHPWLQYQTNGSDYKIAVWLEREESCGRVRDDGGGSTCCPILGRGTAQESKGRSWEAYEVFSEGARNWMPTY